MEQRVTRLETCVETTQKDIAEIKVDIRRLGDKIDSLDSRLSGTIDLVEQRISAKLDSITVILSDLRVGRVVDRVWSLLMMAALLGIMARAFKWL